MNRFNKDLMPLDEIRKHIDLAQQNERNVAGHPDIAGSTSNRSASATSSGGSGRMTDRAASWGTGWPSSRASGR